MPPSEIRGTSNFASASATVAIAEICGTPTPATTRVVQIDPGPMPTLTPSAPASTSARAASAVTIFPPTTWRFGWAALIFAIHSAVGTTAFPAMWPQRFGKTWSSMNNPATPAFSYSRTARATLVTLPNPVSASASSGSTDRTSAAAAKPPKVIATGKGYGEVYAALETSTLDAVEINLTSIQSEKYDEIAKHLTLTGHYFWPSLMVINKAVFDGLTAEQLTQLVIAYEPVWAIGTGRTATPEQAAEAHGHIRQRLHSWFGADPAEGCHIIYGGSVKPENAKDLVRQANVDGALVGGASLDVASFFGIVSRSRPGTV